MSLVAVRANGDHAQAATRTDRRDTEGLSPSSGPRRCAPCGRSGRRAGPEAALHVAKASVITMRCIRPSVSSRTSRAHRGAGCPSGAPPGSLHWCPRCGPDAMRTSAKQTSTSPRRSDTPTPCSGPGRCPRPSPAGVPIGGSVPDPRQVPVPGRAPVQRRHRRRSRRRRTRGAGLRRARPPGTAGHRNLDRDANAARICQLVYDEVVRISRHREAMAASTPVMRPESWSERAINGS